MSPVRVGTWFALMPPQVIPVDSNSTRTESSVAIRPDPIARVPVDVPKAADHNGYQQITRPSREMEAGLKMLLCPQGMSCVS